MDSNEYIEAPDSGLTVLALKEILDTLIEQGKGDYKLAYSIGEYDGLSNGVRINDHASYYDYKCKTLCIE